MFLVQCCSDDTTIRPSHLILELPTQPGTRARTGKPWSLGKGSPFRSRPGAYRDPWPFRPAAPAETLLRVIRCPGQPAGHWRRCLDPGQRQHISEGSANPLAIAYGPSPPLGPGSGPSLYKVEHGSMVSSALQVAKQDAGRQLHQVFVSQLKGPGYGVTLYHQPP